MLVSSAEIFSNQALGSPTRPTRRTKRVFLTLERLGLLVNRSFPTLRTCTQPHLTYPTLAATFP